MTTTYRPRIQWMQGREVRHTTHSEVFTGEEIYGFGEAFADALAQNGAVTFETTLGEWLTLPARSITEIRYQPVQVDSLHRPETLPVREPGAALNAAMAADPRPRTGPVHCCSEHCPCGDPANDAAASCPCWPGHCTCGDADALTDRDVTTDGA